VIGPEPPALGAFSSLAGEASSASSVAAPAAAAPRSGRGEDTPRGLAWPAGARPAVLLLGLFCYALAFQGTRGLWEPDEGRYTAVALEMERLGDYLLPHLNHESIHLTKPPLTYWLMAGSMRVFGHDEWAARLPNALAFVATVVVMAGLAKRLTPEAALSPAVVYALSLLPVAAANVVSADTLLTLWETLAVYAFAELTWGPVEGERRHRALLWLALGLAFLTKGPPGLVPLIPIALFRIQSTERADARRLVSWPTLLSFAAVGLTWYFVIVATTPGALTYLVRREVFDRLFTGAIDRNSGWLGPLEAYLPVIVLGALPWGRELLAGARSAPRWIRVCWWRNRRAADPTGYFLALWLAAPLVVFLAARSRMPLYLLPLAAPASLLIARQAPALTASRRRVAAIGLWIAVMVLGRGALAQVATSKDSRALASAIRASAPARPAEVVFVETQPRFGVALYLDAEVERVAIYPPPPAAIGTPTEPLVHELAENEGVRVFVVSSEDVDSFRTVMREVGVEVLQKGRWRSLSFFWVAEDLALPPSRPG
jgi:4-amino-4-deoxy-L-arabinose transferase